MTSSIHNLFSELILPWARGGEAPAQGMDGTAPEFNSWLGIEPDPSESLFDELVRVERSQWHWCEVRFDGFDGPFFFYTPRLWTRVEHKGRKALVGRQRPAGGPDGPCQKIELMPRADWASRLSGLLQSQHVTALYFEPLLAPNYCQWLFATVPSTPTVPEFGAMAEAPACLWSAWSAGDWLVVSQGEAWTPEVGRLQISAMLLSSPWHGWIEAARPACLTTPPKYSTLRDLMPTQDDARALTRRGFLKSATIFAGAISTGMLAGCRQRAGVPGARVTLTQWYHQYGEEGTQDAVMRYARQYTESHPGVAVQVVWVPGDYQTKLNTALLTSGGPDVFEKQLSVPMVSAQQVAPLDDLFTPEIRRDFLPDDLLLNTVDGRIYGVKMVGDMGLLYFRRSLFEKAGLKPPSTWDELLAASNALNAKGRKGLFVGNDGGVGALLTIAPWSARSELIKGDKILFDNARTAKSFEKLRELANSPSVLIGAQTDWWDPSAFTSEQAAMQWGGLWAFPAIKKKFGEDVGAVPWPALDAEGTPVTFAGGWSQMVNASSPNVEEAKKYVSWLWLENREIQTDWNLSYGFHVPPRLSVARSAAPLRLGVPAEAVEVVAKFGKITPPQWSAGMNTALNDAASNIVKQGRDAKAEVSLAAKKCERELARLLRYKE